ncbi:MAG: transposase [candidate division WOR-3 bacterium]|nr:transposase [candidate division WOR-3 bacterium]
MRTSRVTYKGAYHHVMNRGIEGKNIFLDNKSKEYFLKLLKEKRKILKVRILAYCVMDNHYHLVLQNSSGRLSDFMRQLNGQYGINYRKKNGGRGHVFQDRYKSTLIQEDPYLSMAVVYVLLNPVRAGIIKNPYEYRWSSIGEYFKENRDKIVDNKYVEHIFQSKEVFEELLGEWSGKELPIKKTRYGEIIGREDFEQDAIKKFDRRKGKGYSRRMRKEDYIFESPEEVIEKFEQEKGIKITGIRVDTFEGKNLRSELMVRLKDIAGLKYKEIMKYSPFRPLKYSSLGKLYKRAKDRLIANDV